MAVEEEVVLLVETVSSDWGVFEVGGGSQARLHQNRMRRERCATAYVDRLRIDDAEPSLQLHVPASSRDQVPHTCRMWINTPPCQRCSSAGHQ